MHKYNANEIAGEIRKEITKGILSPTDRLPAERALSERFGAARGTIRSAIEQLANDGLVEKRPGSGTFVVGKPPDSVNETIANASPLELIDARFALEPHMCRLAVLNARSSDFADLEALQKQMETHAGDYAQFAELDTSFHAMIARAAGNNLLIWMVSQINNVRNQEQWSQMRHLTLNETMINQYNLQHRKIIEAIRAREPELAAQRMKEHLETARLSLTRSAST